MRKILPALFVFLVLILSLAAPSIAEDSISEHCLLLKAEKLLNRSMSLIKDLQKENQNLREQNRILIESISKIRGITLEQKEILEKMRKQYNLN